MDNGQFIDDLLYLLKVAIYMSALGSETGSKKIVTRLATENPP
jgi:hypothetical protein